MKPLAENGRRRSVLGLIVEDMRALPYNGEICLPVKGRLPSKVAGQDFVV
ncbi:hypothetical protein [Epibacterium ulvae]|nr:hypothetical protein [Epibacterium ulvae]